MSGGQSDPRLSGRDHLDPSALLIEGDDYTPMMYTQDTSVGSIPSVVATMPGPISRPDLAPHTPLPDRSVRIWSMLWHPTKKLRVAIPDSIVFCNGQFHSALFTSQAQGDHCGEILRRSRLMTHQEVCARMLKLARADPANVTPYVAMVVHDDAHTAPVSHEAIGTVIQYFGGPAATPDSRSTPARLDTFQLVRAYVHPYMGLRYATTYTCASPMTAQEMIKMHGKAAFTKGLVRVDPSVLPPGSSSCPPPSLNTASLSGTNRSSVDLHRSYSLDTMVTRFADKYAVLPEDQPYFNLLVPTAPGEPERSLLEGPVSLPDVLRRECERITISIVSFLAYAHGLCVKSLTCELIQNFDKQLILTSIDAIDLYTPPFNPRSLISPAVVTAWERRFEGFPSSSRPVLPQRMSMDSSYGTSMINEPSHTTNTTSTRSTLINSHILSPTSSSSTSSSSSSSSASRLHSTGSHASVEDATDFMQDHSDTNRTHARVSSTGIIPKGGLSTNSLPRRPMALSQGDKGDTQAATLRSKPTTSQDDATLPSSSSPSSSLPSSSSSAATSNVGPRPSVARLRTQRPSSAVSHSLSRSSRIAPLSSSNSPPSLEPPPMMNPNQPNQTSLHETIPLTSNKSATLGMSSRSQRVLSGSGRVTASHSALEGLRTPGTDPYRVKIDSQAVGETEAERIARLSRGEGPNGMGLGVGIGLGRAGVSAKGRRMSGQSSSTGEGMEGKDRVSSGVDLNTEFLHFHWRHAARRLRTELTTTAAELHATKEQLRVTSEELALERQSHASNAAQLVIAQDNLIRERDELKSQIQSLTSQLEVAKASGELATLRNELSTQRSRVEELIRANTRLDNSLMTEAETNAQLSRQLEAARADATRMAQEMERLKAEAAMAQKQKVQAESYAFVKDIHTKTLAQMLDVCGVAFSFAVESKSYTVIKYTNQLQAVFERQVAISRPDHPIRSTRSLTAQQQQQLLQAQLQGAQAQAHLLQQQALLDRFSQLRDAMHRAIGDAGWAEARAVIQQDTGGTVKPAKLGAMMAYFAKRRDRPQQSQQQQQQQQQQQHQTLQIPGQDSAPSSGATTPTVGLSNLTSPASASTASSTTSSSSYQTGGTLGRPS